MPWLTSLLTTLFGWLLSFFGKFLTKKLARAAFAVTLFTTITATFIAAINALFSSFAVAMPLSILAAYHTIVPDNADNCLAAYLAAHAARWIYIQNTKVIQYSLFN